VRYNCIIIEDNPLDRYITSRFISKINSFNLLALCSNSEEAASVLESEDVDIVFSDVDMPVLSGIEFLKTLKKPPAFIFTSSFGEFAAEAYSLDAVDFIIKPFKFERFFQASSKAIEFIESKKLRKERDLQERALASVPSLSITAVDNYFFINQMRGVTRLRYSDVLYIESMGDSSLIYTLNDEQFTILVGLKKVAEQISNLMFKRIHRKFIVNVDHIEHIIGNSVRLDTKHVLSMGELYRKDVMEHFITKKVVGRNIE
jgi:two-component system LytT family response regulator